jgi:hypothetical protein
VASAIFAAKSAITAAHHWIIYLRGWFFLWHPMPLTHMWWLRCSNCKVITGSCYISSLGRWPISMSGIPHFDCELLVVFWLFYVSVSCRRVGHPCPNGSHVHFVLGISPLVCPPEETIFFYCEFTVENRHTPSLANVLAVLLDSC